MNHATLEALYLGVPSLLLCFAMLYWARHKHMRTYWLRYRIAHKALSDCLIAVSPSHARLLSDPHGLLSAKQEFVNSSAEQHLVALKQWAEFLADYHSASTRKSQSEELEIVISRRYTGLQSLRRLKEAISLLAKGDPPDTAQTQCGSSLVASAALAMANLERFDRAIKSNKKKLESFKQEKADLELALSKARKLDLLHPSFQMNFDKIERLLKELEGKLLNDPLDAQNRASKYLQAKLNELAKVLEQALQQGVSAADLFNRENLLRVRVKELQSAPVKSALAEVPTFAEGHKFDEPGFVLSENLSECARLKLTLQNALQNRLNISFKQSRPALSKALGQAEKLIETVLSDKAQVDSVIELVYKNASEEDVEADKAQRAVIAAAYKEQRFHEASLAAQTLRGYHELRSQSREAIGKVAQPLEKVVRLLSSNKDLISHDLDHRFQLLVCELAELGREAQRGHADWAALTELAQRLTDRLIGEAASSIMQCAKAEIQAHAKASAELGEVQEQMAFLKQHLAWAGLAESSSTQMAEASSVVAAAKMIKQDWNAALARAQGANAVLAEVRRLVDEALSVHEAHRQLLAAFENQLSSCGAQDAYVREICGKKFGLALYCQDEQAKALLPKLSQSLEKRNYEALRTELSAARAILFAENLETWWNCLQLMATSGVPCARSFAMQEGYVVGAYKRFVDEKLHLCGLELYQPATFASCSLHKSPLCYRTETRAADPPRASDYKAAIPKAPDAKSGAT